MHTARRFGAGCLVAAAIAVAATGAEARPWRVLQVPNGSVAQCLTCHIYPGGPRNAFGTNVENFGGVGFLENGDVKWGKAVLDPAHPSDPPKTLAELDSDGDGRTNGAELLDPAGTWRTGDPDPGEPTFVRLPGRLDSPVVIRQLYVAGGASGAAYQQDFIELFNRSDTERALDGWSLQYAPPAGVTNFAVDAASITELPAVTLAPGQSLLVQAASGGTNGTPLSGADVVDATPLALGEGGGKLALVASTSALGCNGSPNVCSDAAFALIVDLVGYGNATFYELGAAQLPSSTQALTRNRGGCADINANGPGVPPVPADFTLVVPAPRSSTSPVTLCYAVPAAVPSPVPALGPWMLGALSLLLALSSSSRPAKRVAACKRTGA